MARGRGGGDWRGVRRGRLGEGTSRGRGRDGRAKATGAGQRQGQRRPLRILQQDMIRAQIDCEIVDLQKRIKSATIQPLPHPQQAQSLPPPKKQQPLHPQKNCLPPPEHQLMQPPHPQKNILPPPQHQVMQPPHPQPPSSPTPPVVSNIYYPSGYALNRNQEEVMQIRKGLEISIVQGHDRIPNPMINFEEGGLPNFVVKVFQNEKIDRPTGVQAQSWPTILSGENLVSIAKPGSGKTYGYLLPSVLHVMEQAPLGHMESPMVLVIAPTRDLAKQIEMVAQKLADPCDIRTMCLIGGVKKQQQLRSLAKGAQIVIATPGRLNDILETSEVSFQRCTFVVIDEADRMLDLGFETQIRKCLGHLRPDRQISLWSATWPKGVKKFAEEVMGRKDFCLITVGCGELSTNPDILQIVEVCTEAEKEEKLLKILMDLVVVTTNKVIIFVGTRRKCDELAKSLLDKSFVAVSLHGVKPQEERDCALEYFRTGVVQILVATDVAGRGLDVDDVKWVINYDFPEAIEDYVHRIGRAGRKKEQDATAMTFFTSRNRIHAATLVKILTEAKQVVNPQLLQMQYMLTLGYGGASEQRFGK